MNDSGGHRGAVQKPATSGSPTKHSVEQTRDLLLRGLSNENREELVDRLRDIQRARETEALAAANRIRSGLESREMFNSSATIHKCFQAAVEEGERAITDAIQAAFDLGVQKGDDDAIANFLFADLYDFLRAFLMGNWGLHPGAWREAQAQLTTVQSLASRVSEQVRSAREGVGAGGPRDSEPKRQPERQPAKHPERQPDTQPQSAVASDGPGADQRLHSDFQRLRASTTSQGREGKPQSRSPAAPTAAAAVNAPAAIRAHSAVSPSAAVKSERTSVRVQPVSSQKPDEPQPRGCPAEPTPFSELRMLGVDYRDGALYLIFDRAASREWMQLFRNPPEPQSFKLGCEPSRFDFCGPVAWIRIQGSFAQAAVDDAKKWTAIANRHYPAIMRQRQHDAHAKDRAEEEERGRETEEEAIRAKLEL